MIEIQNRLWCASNDKWSCDIGRYTVTYGKADPGYQYARQWKCTCPAYKYRRKPTYGAECKHIKQAQEKFCGYGKEALWGEAIDFEGNTRCPKCNSHLHVIRIAV